MHLPAVLLLKVMDNEPGALALWLRALVLGTAGYVAARFRLRFLALLVVAMLSLSLWSWVSALSDRRVGAAMRAEGGTTYVWQGYASFAVIGVASLAGWVVRRRSYRVPTR